MSPAMPGTCSTLAKPLGVIMLTRARGWPVGVVCVNVLATFFGQVAPISANNVQAFELLLDAVSPFALDLNHQGSVLLLLQQQK